MPFLEKLLEKNRRWATEMFARDSSLFERLEQGQNPHYLWIGCSDSRVLAINSLGLGPGEIFVHRNIANQARLDDHSCQAVLQYATTALNVEKILVCGHYGCGGVAAAADDLALGADLDICLHDLKQLCKEKLPVHQHDPDCAKRLVEENVCHQVAQVANSPHIINAWQQGRPVSIHGLVFDIATGLIEELECVVKPPSDGQS